MHLSRKASLNIAFYISILIFALGSISSDLNAQIKIMPLGDGITYDDPGDSRDSTQRGGYRRFLWYMLDSAGYDVDFVGSRKAGQNLIPAFDVDNEGWPLVDDAWLAGHVYQFLVQNPADIILLHIGTNTINYRTTPDYVEDILNEIDRYESTYGRHVTVILPRIISRIGGSPNTTLFNNNVISMANSRIDNLGDDIITVDFEYGIGMKYTSNDMVSPTHPNDIGYRKLAYGWFNVLKNILPTPAPFAPVIGSSPQLSGVVGNRYVYNTQASGYPAPTYSLLTYPAGMVINSTTGIIEWTPTAGGNFSVSVIASNGSGSNTQSFSINVASSYCPTQLINKWNLDEGTGSVVYDSYDDVNGSLMNSPSWTSDAVSGNALTFNGSSYVNIPDSNTIDFSLSQSFSIEAWVKFTNVDGSDKVFLGRDLTGSGQWWLGAVESSGDIEFSLINSLNEGAGSAELFGPSINDGVWHYLVAVRDAGVNRNRLYVDGVKVDSTNITYTQGFIDNTILNIACISPSGVPTNFFEGNLDEVAIYNRALSTSEVSTHYILGSNNQNICANKAPVITGQNGTIIVNEETELAIDLDKFFITDADNTYPNGFNLTAYSGSNYSVTGTNRITPDINYSGSLSVPVSVNDGKYESNKYTSTVQVTSVDDPPYVANPIQDITIVEDFGSGSVSVANVFGDVDTPLDQIVKSVLFNSNPALITATVTGNTLNYTTLANHNGTASIVVQGTANGRSANDTLLITVTAVDDYPVMNPISNQTINEGGTFATFDLDNYIMNPDVDPVILSYIGNNQLTVSIDAQHIVTVTTPNSNWFGIETITFIVTDQTPNHYSDSTSVIFTVTNVDDPPYVLNPISDISTNEDHIPITVDLTTIFDDIDNNPAFIVKSVLSNSNTSLVSTSISAEILTLTFASNHNGSAQLIIQATSNLKTITDTFFVTVSAVDDYPDVLAIPNQTINEGATFNSINLSSYLTEVDGNAVTWSYSGNVNLLVAISGANATITTPNIDWNGIENIWFKATDQTTSHLADSSMVVFTVTPVDDDPYVANPISDVTVNEDAVNTVINLSNVFSDIDNDPALISKTIQSNNNTALVTATIAGNSLTLDYLDNKNGVATIRVLGTSGGRSVYDEFIVTVNAVDDHPDLAAIPAQTIDEGSSFASFNFNSYLTELDGDAIQFSYKNNTNLIVQILGDGTTTISTPNVDWFGTETIRFLATDQTTNHYADSVNVVFTVNPIDDPPHVAQPISDIIANEDDPNSVVDLTHVFEDIDNNNIDIQKYVEFVGNPALITVTISGNLMTLHYQANQHGSSNVIVRAHSNGKDVLDTFNVSVIAVDDPPDVLPINNRTILEGNSFQTIDLQANYLHEVDGDIVQWNYSGNSQLSVSISPTGIATIHTPNPDWFGSEFIRFTATDQTANHLSDYTDVIFTVTPVDDPPFVIHPLSNITVNEDASNSIIDLSLVFSDIDNDVSSIAKAVTENSDPTILNPSISGNILTISYLPDRHGIVSLIISGTSNSKTAYDTVQITVQPVDDKPDVGTIPYQSISEGGTFNSINLNDFLTEVDGDPVTWSYHGNTSLAISIISGQAGISTPNVDWYGSETVWFVATDQTPSHLKDSAQVVFNVVGVDDPPYVANPVADVTVNEDSPNSIIPLIDEFNDIDNPVAQIVKSIIIINNPSLVSISIASNILTIDYLDNRYGTATFVIRAFSGNQYAYDTVVINVLPIDDAPIVNAIPGQTINEGSSFAVFDLDNYITELDGDGITWSYSGNTDLIVNINAQNQVTISPPNINWNGSETIRFTATDNTSSHLSSYSEAIFAVDPDDDPPYVENPIADVTVNEDALTSIINISTVFNDIDNSQSSIIKTIADNSNSALVLAYVIGNSLYLDYQDNQHGVSTIIVNGLSNGKSVNDTLIVTVNAIDDPPVVNTMDDLIVNEGESFPTFDLDDYLSEFDGDAVTWSYSGNTNLSVQILPGNIVSMAAFNSDWFGSETIKFTATDNTTNHLSGFSNVLCIVNPVDDAPYVQNPIADQTVDEDFGSFNINISTTFNDIDNSQAAITYSIAGNNNPSLLSASVLGSTITINSILNHNGSARIIVQALSNNKTVSDTFFVTVLPVDDAPVVSGIQNQHISEGGAFATIPLNNRIIEYDGNTVSWSYSNNSPLNISIGPGNNATVATPYADWNGSVTFRFTATDNTPALLSGYQDVTFIVDPVDDAPYVANPLADVHYPEDNAAVDINIDDVFDDIDNDHSELSISIFHRSNPSLFSATVAQPFLHLEFPANHNGSGYIILEGSSGGQSVRDTFIVYVDPVDDYPSFTNIPDQTIDEGSLFTTINLSNYLVELDGDLVSYSYRNNDNLTVNITGNVATITAPNADWFGVDTIQFVAIDQTANNYEGSYNVIFTIDPIDDPPFVAHPLNDVIVNEDQQNIQVLLSNIFGDIDNDPALIIKSVGAISNSSLVSGSVNLDTLNLTLVPNATGSATIRVDGTSNGRTVSDEFLLTVLPVDDAPVVNPIPDQTINEGETFVSFDLDNYLVEYDGNAVQWTASGNTQLGVTINASNIVSVTIPNINWNGYEDIIFTATDQTANHLQGFVLVRFTVSPVDDAPYVAVPISNLVVDEDAVNSSINLTGTFADIDNPVNQMILDVDNISNPDLITAEIINNILSLHYLPNMNGFANVVIRCTSNGQTVYDDFNVVVRSVNDPPVFTIDTVISMIENFSPPVVVTAQPAPVPSDELSQIVRYSLVPSSVGFASISLDQYTGQITVSSVPNQTGSQLITMYANDYQSSNNLFSRTFRLSINPKLEQQILFPVITDKTIIDVPFTISASASSGLPVTLEVLSGPISLNGNLVTINGQGQASIRATQGGNGSYYAATPVTRTFNITKVNQIITFTPVPDKLMTDPPFSIAASASSGLPVTFSVISGGVTLIGNSVTINSPGPVVIRAAQAGNSTYNEATPVDITFNVARMDQTISFPDVGDIAYTTTPIDLFATASSGLTVQFSILSGNGQIINNQLVLSGTGPFIIRASQPGNTSYNAAPDVDQYFEVTKIGQTIDFPSIPDKNYHDLPFKLEATASSGLPILFYVLSGPATISGDTLTIIDVGSVTVRARQPGNSQYDAAEDVDITFYVNASDQEIINFIVPSIIFLNNDPILLTAESTSGLEVSFTVLDGDATIDSSNHLIVNSEGTVIVRASQGGNEYFDAAPDVDREIIVVLAVTNISLVQIVSPSDGSELPFNEPIEIAVRVKNTGNLIIEGFTLEYNIDDGLKIVDEIVNDTLIPGDSILYTFDAKWTTLTGSHDICVSVEPLDNESYLTDNNACIHIDITTDLTDYDLDATVKTYPNPADHLLNFEVSNQIKEGIIYFYDTHSKLVKTCSFGTFNTSSLIKIDVSDLAQGLYFYTLISNSNTYFGKFVKY